MTQIPSKSPSKGIPRPPLIAFPSDASEGSLRWPGPESPKRKLWVDEYSRRDPEGMAVCLNTKERWNIKEYTRELYDCLGALLIAATQEIQSDRQGQARSEEALALLNELQRSLNTAVDLRHRIAKHLGLSESLSIGLFGAIRWQLSHPCLNRGIQCAWRGSKEPPLKAEAAISLFCFVKDALQLISVNILSAAVLYAFVKPTTLTLQFTFNRDKETVGEAPQVQHLEERIQTLGGRFTFIGSSSGGSSLRAEIPVSPQGEKLRAASSGMRANSTAANT
jgi:signal transduction histidine kinase